MPCPEITAVLSSHEAAAGVSIFQLLVKLKLNDKYKCFTSTQRISHFHFRLWFELEATISDKSSWDTFRKSRFSIPKHFFYFICI